MTTYRWFLKNLGPFLDFNFQSFMFRAFCFVLRKWKKPFLQNISCGSDDFLHIVISMIPKPNLYDLEAPWLLLLHWNDLISYNIMTKNGNQSSYGFGINVVKTS